MMNVVCFIIMVTRRCLFHGWSCVTSLFSRAMYHLPLSGTQYIPHISYSVRYATQCYLEVVHMLSAEDIRLCNSGITLWLTGTMPLTDLCHVLFWTCAFRMEMIYPLSVQYLRSLHGYGLFRRPF